MVCAGIPLTGGEQEEQVEEQGQVGEEGQVKVGQQVSEHGQEWGSTCDCPLLARTVGLYCTVISVLAGTVQYSTV